MKNIEIIKQSHEIISLPDDLLKTIEKAGRTCYKSEDKITEDSANRFVEMLIKRGHEAMIEFGDIIVKFITDRGVTHELVRHRMCSFAQESTRYCNYANKPIKFITPCYWPIDGFEWGAWMEALQKSAQVYKRLITKYHCTPQEARAVLPNSLKTEINVKANIREWRHIFSLRCAKAAHPQIRALMLPLLKELQKKLPVVFDDFNYEELRKGIML